MALGTKVKVGVVFMKLIFLVEQQEKVLSSEIKVWKYSECLFLTFNVSDNTNDSILSSRLFILRSAIPVKPHGTFDLMIKSLRIRSPTSR